MLRKGLIAGTMAGAVGLLAASAASATTFNVGSPNFFITAGTPFTPSITAVFFDTPAAGAFDDSFTFTIPTQSGLGSGSISTSFSGMMNQLAISSLTINTVPYTLMSGSNGQSLSVGNINIQAGVQNTLRVIGTSMSGQGSFSGTATFTAVSSAVPESATWLMAIVGFGFVGFSLRQRKASALTFA